jgi:hypothetical protein
MPKAFDCASSKDAEGKCTLWPNLPEHLEHLLKPSSSGPGKLGPETEGGKYARARMRREGWRESADPGRWFKVDTTSGGSDTAPTASGSGW